MNSIKRFQLGRRYISEMTGHIREHGIKNLFNDDMVSKLESYRAMQDLIKPYERPPYIRSLGIAFYLGAWSDPIKGFVYTRTVRKGVKMLSSENGGYRAL